MTEQQFLKIFLVDDNTVFKDDCVIHLSKSELKKIYGEYFSSQLEPQVSNAKSGNEVTDFGTDYDGAISAGKDGWQCGNCEKWNKKEHYVCKHCVEYEK